MFIVAAPAVPASADVVNGSVRRQHSNADCPLLFVTMVVASRNCPFDLVVLDVRAEIAAAGRKNANAEARDRRWTRLKTASMVRPRDEVGDG